MAVVDDVIGLRFPHSYGWLGGKYSFLITVVRPLLVPRE